MITVGSLKTVSQCNLKNKELAIFLKELISITALCNNAF